MNTKNMNTAKSSFITWAFMVCTGLSQTQSVQAFQPNLLTYYGTISGWAWNDHQTGINPNFLKVADINGDGHNELLMFNNINNDLTKVYIYKQNLGSLYCELAVDGHVFDAHIYQSDQDAASEVALASNNTIYVFDGRTCELENQIPFPVEPEHLRMDDTNGDGVLDVVYRLDGSLYLMSLDDVNNPIVRGGLGGFDLAIVDTGQPPRKDVVVFNTHMYLLNGENFTTINEYTDIFHGNYGLGDINGDGQYEVAYKSSLSSTVVSVVDMFSGNLIAEVETNDYGSVMDLIDVDGDLKDDILIQGMYAYNRMGEEVLNIEQSMQYVNNHIQVDWDQDGQAELIFIGRAEQSSIYNQLFMVASDTGQTLWKSSITSGPYQLAKTVERQAGRQVLGVGFFDSDQGYGMGGAMTLDLGLGTVSSSLYQQTVPGWGEISDLELGRLTDNDDPVVCYSGDIIYDVFVTCEDLNTGDPLWFRDHPNGYGRYMEIIDLDEDDQRDLMMVSGNGKVSAYQLQNGFLKWHSDSEIEPVYGGFHQLFLINKELWLFHEKRLHKINPVNGVTLSVTDTDLTTLSYQAGVLYGVIEGVGFGRINPVDLSMDELIFATTEDINYLTVSEDGQVAFIAHNESPSSAQLYEPEKIATIVSISGAFPPHDMGLVSLYDSFFPNGVDLYISTERTVRHLDLRILNDHIFDDDFE